MEVSAMDDTRMNLLDAVVVLVTSVKKKNTNIFNRNSLDMACGE